MEFHVDKNYKKNIKNVEGIKNVKTFFYINAFNGAYARFVCDKRVFCVQICSFRRWPVHTATYVYMTSLMRRDTKPSRTRRNRRPKDSKTNQN